MDLTQRWLTFDCFGTLIDWRHGIAATGDLLFPGRGRDILEAYHRVEPEIEREQPYRRYREVLTEAMRRVASELSLPLRDADADALATTIPYWPVFADVAEALTACRADGWRLALLTNCDRDLIAQTLRRLPVPFEAAVTAEDVSAYKPDPSHFRRFEASFAPRRGEWIHVAQSEFHDVIPAGALGIRTVWINRLGEAESGAHAGAMLPDLTGLPATVRSMLLGQ